MRCLRKFQWIKLFRDNLPEGKGILGFWAKLAACAAYRNGTSLYCGFENEVKAGSWVGGIVGIKSILGLKSRQETIKVLDKLVQLGYIEYEIGPINSYSTLDAKITVCKAFPDSPPSVRAPIAARPIATPACGINANPK